VCTLDEALALRAAGLTAPVLAWLLVPGLPLHDGVTVAVDLSAGTMGLLAEVVAAFTATLPVETLQPPYHLFHRDIEAEVLPYARAHDIGVLVYGPLAHGLLSGHLTADARFPEGDWRAQSPDFTGDAFARNLRIVAALEQLANNELGVPISRLAVAWALANPAVHVAIIGTRDAKHVDDAIAAADLELSEEVLRRIDEIAHDAVRVAGPRPEAM